MFHSRRRKFIVLFALAAAIVACFALFACGESVPAEGVEKVTEFSYDFSYTMKAYGRVRLGIEKGTEAESARAEIAASLEGDYDALCDVFGSGAIVTLYVLDDARAHALPEAFFSDGKLYCKASALAGEGFLTYFSAAFLGKTQPWKAIAARAAAFGPTSDVSDGELGDHLSEEPQTLSLFAAYYCEAFASAEQMRYAVAAAEKFGAFLMDRRGSRVLFRTEKAGDREDFAASLGVEVSFTEGERGLWEAECGQSSAYPLVLEGGDRRYFLAPIPEADFASPARVLSVLSDAETATETIMRAIEERAPVAYHDVQTRSQNLLTFYLSPEERAKTSVSKGVVCLSDPAELVRETARLLTGADGQSIPWLEEGLATYFAEFETYRVGAEQREIFALFAGPEEGFEGDDLAFLRAVKARCAEQGESFVDLVSYHHVRVLESAAYVTLREPALKETLSFAWAAASIGERFSLTEAEGTALTLPEAYLLVKYAVARLGMDDVLCASMAGSPAKLGATYSDLRAALQSEVEAGVTTWAPKLPDTSDQDLRNDLVLLAFVGVAVVLAVVVVLFFTRKRN